MCTAVVGAGHSHFARRAMVTHQGQPAAAIQHQQAGLQQAVLTGDALRADELPGGVEARRNGVFDAQLKVER